MSSHLRISIGQHSDKGRKETNQDFYGACIPKELQLVTKGVAIALADGISSSEVSQIASEAAVTGFLEDYFCTSDAWSVKKSAQKVLSAINSWLYAQTRQSQYPYDKDRGYVCALSAMVIKSNTAHIFHVGDTRVYRLRNNHLEQLTNDHRIFVSQDKSYLGRALGVNPQIEIDYQNLQVEKGDVFVLATDGLYEYASPRSIVSAVEQHYQNLEDAAKEIVQHAFRQGSPDNLTIQILSIDGLPDQDAGELYRELTELPLAPVLRAGCDFEGYRIGRELCSSYRSHVYSAVDTNTGMSVAIKIPSIDLRGDPDYLERFTLEEWIARRINSPYVLKACEHTRKRNYRYIVTELVQGSTLRQWMIDHPKPDIESVRVIVEQLAKGLLAFHRMEMLHQDVRPENVMIDGTGLVKIIDFGSAKVAGIMEMKSAMECSALVGSAQYTAPEYFLGESGTVASDIFSLGVVAYEMLSGRLPYGAEVPKARTATRQRKLKYCSVLDNDREIPVWLDAVLRRAVHPNPIQRYRELSEFTRDLRRPSRELMETIPPRCWERHPVGFWKGVSLVLAMVTVVLLLILTHRGINDANDSEKNTLVGEGEVSANEGTDD